MKRNVFFTILFYFVLYISISAQLDTIKYQWPFPPFHQSHGINGTFCEFRNTGSYDHFHNAIDIGQPDGNPVYSCLDGIIYSIVTSAGSNSYVSVSTKILGQWKRLTYVHVVPNPNLYVGLQVKAGVDTLGFVHSGMGHTHLIERELVNSLSDYAVEINNLRENGGVTPYIDTYPPIIHRNTLQFRLNNTDIKLPANALSNKVDIIIKIEEQNGPAAVNKNNGTYIVGYRIWSADTSTIVYQPKDDGVRYRFDRKPYDEDVHKVYLKGVATLSNPVYIITNGNGADSINQTRSIPDNYFNTEILPEGNYQLEIFSEDTRHNYAHQYFPITITRKDVVPPSIPILTAIENYNGEKSVRVRWLKNPEPDVKGYRLYYTGNTLLTGWHLAADENMLTNKITSYSIDSPSQFIVPTNKNVYFFYLTAVDSSGNESQPSDIYSRSSYIDGTGYPKVLIVDGFNRYGGTGGWQKPTHAFNVTYFKDITVLDSAVISSCSNDAVINGTIDLNDYKLVIWFLGDESTTNRTFTTKEQGKVAAYLENGGNFFVTGSEIGWDLDRRHTNSQSSDTLFYRHYLKARFVYDGNIQMNSAYGIDGTDFQGVALSFGQVYPEKYPDDINPVYGSHAILRYNTKRPDLITYRKAAVAYKGTFGNSNKVGSLIYVAFGFETIGSFSHQVSFMQKALEYFSLITQVKNNSKLTMQFKFKLFNNYPNPFNPSTKIKFIIPKKDFVSLKIYDALGRKVSTLADGVLNKGFHEFTWNAENFASGIYFARLVAGSYNKTIRMLLLK